MEAVKLFNLINKICSSTGKTLKVNLLNRTYLKTELKQMIILVKALGNTLKIQGLLMLQNGKRINQKVTLLRQLPKEININ